MRNRDKKSMEIALNGGRSLSSDNEPVLLQRKHDRNNMYEDYLSLALLFILYTLQGLKSTKFSFNL